MKTIGGFVTMRQLAYDKIVTCVAPVDTNGVGASGDKVSLKNYEHCVIAITVGSSEGNVGAVTLKQATLVDGTGSKALAFTSMWKIASNATDDTETLTAVTSNTFDIGAAAYEKYFIEIDAEDLDIDNDFDVLGVELADPGSAMIVGVEYYLSQARYKSDAMPSAIID